MDELSTVQHGCIGAAVGSLEQAMMRPTVFWKAEMQQQRFCWSRAVNPRYCYRGFAVAVVSIAPITCIQFAATNASQAALSRGGSKRSAEVDRVLCGAFAGSVSAVAQSPFQLVEINQQLRGGTMGSMARRVLREHGLRGFFRGFSMTATREGIFCASYTGVAPMLKSALLAKYPEMTDGTAVAASSIVAGTFGAALSHPADTLKTCLQGSLFPPQDADGASAASRFHQVSGPRQALRYLREQGPLRPQVYRGYTPRAFRVVCCTYIYTNLTEVFENLMRTTFFPAWGEVRGPQGLLPASPLVGSSVQCQERPQQ